MSRSADELLAAARTRIRRVRPEDLAAASAAGALVVDIRPEAQRRAEGVLPEAVVIERNVLEWRLDPQGDHRLATLRGREHPVVVVCSAGYSSSLAAASLVDLGLEDVGDLEGGFLAWRAWSDEDAPVAGP